MSTYLLIIMVKVLARLLPHPQYSEMTVEGGHTQAFLRENPKAIVAAAIGLSQTGKSAFFNRFFPSDPVFSAHSSEEVALLASTKAVTLGEAQLILTKLTGFSQLDEDYLKMMYVTMRVADWVLVFLEKVNFFSNLKTIMEIGREANSSRERPIDRIYVMVDEKQWLSKESNAINMQKFQQHPLSPCCEFLERGTSLTEPLFSTICTTLQAQSSLFLSSQHANTASKVPEVLQTLSEQFTFCLKYRDFQRDHPAKDRLRYDRIQFDTVSTHPLFTKENGEIQVNDGALEALVAHQFDPNTPTVVLMVLGTPGTGKSTLLNQICKELLLSKTVPHKFKIGNTTTHTTLESEFLPLAMRLNDDLQVLLVDLEGLTGTETKNPRLAKTQKGLVAALLAVASVPCIIIENSNESLRFVGEQLGDIKSHQENFKLLVEKVLLLFHDKDGNAGENREIAEIPSIWKAPDKLPNTTIQVMNKPSFVSSTSDSIRRFIQQLLSECAYPKRNTEGQTITLESIIKHIRDITDSVKKTCDIILDPPEAEINAELQRNWTSEFDRIIAEIRVNGDELCERGGEKMREMMERVEGKTEQYRFGMRKKIRGEIEEYIKEKLESLEIVQNLYRQLRCLDINTIKSDSSKMKLDLNVLRRVANHYPSIEPVLRPLFPEPKSRILSIAAVSALAAGLSAVLYKYVNLHSALTSIKEAATDIGITRLSSSLLASATLSSVLSQSAVLPLPYTAHTAIQRQNERISIVNALTGLLTAIVIANLGIKQWKSAWYPCTGLTITFMIFFRYRCIMWRNARIRAKVELFHMPAALIPYYMRITEESMPVLLLIGVNSGSQAQFVSDFLALCYPYTLKQGAIPLEREVNVLPYSYLTSSGHLSNALLVNIPLSTDPLQGTVPKYVRKTVKKLLSIASATVVFLDKADDVSLAILNCLGEGNGEVYVCYEERDGAAKNLTQQFRFLGFSATEERKLEETKKFAKEMYAEKVENMRSVERNRAREAFLSLIPFKTS